MKRQLGISIYPDHSSNDEDKAYLELAQRYGFSRIFMSMLEVTEGKRNCSQEILRIIKICQITWLRNDFGCCTGNF